MKTISRLMIVCFLTIILIASIVSYADDYEFGDCPSCWAWRCDDEGGEKVCMISCLEETATYRFYVEIYRWDVLTLQYIFEWRNVLMILEGSSNCDPCCYEYTTVFYLPDHWDGFSGEWKVIEAGEELPICHFMEFLDNPFE